MVVLSPVSLCTSGSDFHWVTVFPWSCDWALLRWTFYFCILTQTQEVLVPSVCSYFSLSSVSEFQFDLKELVTALFIYFKSQTGSRHKDENYSLSEKEKSVNHWTESSIKSTHSCSDWEGSVSRSAGFIWCCGRGWTEKMDFYSLMLIWNEAPFTVNKAEGFYRAEKLVVIRRWWLMSVLWPLYFDVETNVRG